MNTQPVTNTADVETLLRELLTDQYSDFLDSLRTWNTYEDAGILTSDKGLVLTFANGAEFQLTIVQSRWGRADEAEDTDWGARWDAKVAQMEIDADEAAEAAEDATWDIDLYSR